jgi:hypothetical protein
VASKRDKLLRKSKLKSKDESTETTKVKKTKVLHNNDDTKQK